jgi:hypothetical protein
MLNVGAGSDPRGQARQQGQRKNSSSEPYAKHAFPQAFHVTDVERKQVG